MLYKLLVRPFLFLFSAERAHQIAFLIMKSWRIVPGLTGLIRHLNQPPRNASVQLAGINFSSRVGLAAGFDKDAMVYRQLSALGFGFLEIGTVTPKPQPGNPKPRLFRLIEDEAIINRMGFNNKGVYAAAKRLKSRPSGLVIGGNIGKNKATSNEEAVSDYLICMRALREYVDFFTINISSPNTPGLRELQDKEPLRLLLEAVMNENNSSDRPLPVFLKIAPDISFSQADEIVDLALKVGLSGLIVSNTTVSRDGLSTANEAVESIGMGGLSGRPLLVRSTELLSHIAKRSKPGLVLIASGGIMSAEDAGLKFKAGADLVQLYTGFVYKGPSLIKEINRMAF